MGTISSAFSTVSSGLQADQEALNIVSNNVANANTTGYTREVANFHENDTVQFGNYSYGTGATVTGATSERDKILNERLDQQQQLESASSTRLSSLNTVETLFSVTTSSSSSSGDIGTNLTSFFNTFTSLESQPTSVSLRESVISSAKTLASNISGAATSLSDQQASIDQEASGITSQVNALTTSIAQLNQEIMSSNSTGDAGTLEDKRQEAISQLSQLVGINQITTENNGLSITTTSGTLLVAGSSSYQLSTGTVDGLTHFYSGTTDITSGLTSGGGELGGYLTVRDVDIPNVLSSLDQLAYSVSTKVNALNNSGKTLNGTTGTASDPNYIFSEPTEVSGAAAAMSVVISSTSDIAAAGANGSTGDDSNAVALADLGNQAIVAGQTPSNFYSAMVSALGSTISEVTTENTTLTASVTQLQTQSNSLSSVSLDDEASSMETYERSYEAASKAFTILDSILSAALNLGEATAFS
jgi:flagellar hook-associated protein 1 FlgK